MRTPRTWTTTPFVLVLSVAACTGSDAPPDDTSATAEPAATPAATAPTPAVVARGLNGPIGVLVEEDGTLWVADSGTGGENEMSIMPAGYEEPVTMTWGETARVVRIDPDGTQTDMAMLPSIVIPEGPQGAGRFALMDDGLYVTSTGWGGDMAEESERVANAAAVVRLTDAGATEVANTWDSELRANPDGGNLETNPFDLTVAPDGVLWMTDAAGNCLYRVDPATGTLELVAAFDLWPGPIPNAAHDGDMVVEPVPTAVAFGAGGEVYVSLMGGLPFVPGSSKVVLVSPDGRYTDYATGLTMLTDLVTGPDGRLYGVSIGEFTDQGPVPDTGTVLRIGPGETSETIVSGLSMPASIAFTANGDAYVTLNALGEPGTGQVVKYPGLVPTG